MIPVPMGVYYFITSVVTSGSGTITPSGTLAILSGESQAYSISPSSGWEIGSITIDGTIIENTSSYSFSNISANHTISVSFAVTNDFTIISSVTGDGNIIPLGTTVVSAGGSQLYTFAPSAGYYIEKVLIDGEEYNEGGGPHNG